MKIAFIFKTITLSDPIGTMILSSILKKAGHQITIIYFKKEDINQKLREFKPDIIAFSTTTGIHKEYISLNKKIKKDFKVFSIFGGPHPTFYPEMIQEKGVDAICRGEGEEAILELITKLEKNQNITKIKNIWIKKNNKIFKNTMRPLIQNLDELPAPDRELIYNKDPFFKKLKVKRFMASRGCPYQCSYCFNKKYNEIYEGKGKIVRYRSVDNVIKEIKKIKQKYPLKLVKFIDDTFILDKKWIKEFCNKYKEEINLPFICNVRANLITEELVKDLKKANCTSIYMGIESGNEEIRNKILKREMSDKQILDACKIFKKEKIKILTQNMIGLPGETIKDAFKTILFNAKCKVDLPGFSLFQPYPNTPLTNYAIKNNFFDGNFEKLTSNWANYTYLNYSAKEKKEIENLLKLSIITAKFPKICFLTKHLIKLPKNKLFNLIFITSYGIFQWKIFKAAGFSFKETIKLFSKTYEYLST